MTATVVTAFATGVDMLFADPNMATDVPCRADSVGHGTIVTATVGQPTAALART
jgi:hypothetical protein